MYVYSYTRAFFAVQLQEMWITAVAEKSKVVVFAFWSIHYTCCKHSLHLQHLPILTCDSEACYHPTVFTWLQVPDLWNPWQEKLQTTDS